MSEIYPSDNDLLAITSDDDTGVEYIATGQIPYYLQFRKLLYRLLLSVKRGNDFRVYKAGGLDIGVKPGKCWDNSIALIDYVGISGVGLADDKTNIYVYLNSTGALITNEYTAFPDMSTIPHLRLSKITTLNGEITSLEDARDHHSFMIPGGGGGSSGTLTVEAHTADDTLTGAESGSVHTNNGATGTVTLTLPASADEGTYFWFAVQSAQQFRVDPGIATIRDDCGQTADKYKWADAVGECLHIVADASGDWVTVAKRGTWSEEA